MTTRAEFEAFFAGPWQKMLERIEVPDMPNASWDRKAAYLYMAKADELAGAELDVVLARPTEEDPFDGY
jgi:hypothetical protein